MTNRHRAKYLIATTGVLGLLLSGCADGAGNAPAQPPVPPSSAAGDGVPPPAPSSAQPGEQLLPAVGFPRAELDADDQRGDGAKALIKQAELAKPGFVAVFDPAGKLLGSAPVAAGPQRDVAVTLDPALGKGDHRLRVVLLADDGDGKLDLAKDAPVKDDADEPDEQDRDIEDDGFTYGVA